MSSPVVEGLTSALFTPDQRDLAADVAARAGDVVARVGDAAPGWEQDGCIPRSVFSEIGRLGLYRDRWADGWRGGLLHSVALTATLMDLSPSLALTTSLHSDVFLGLLHLARRSAVPLVDEVRSAALDGDVVGCFATTELGGGSDPRANVRTTARRVDDGVAVQGSKAFVTNAGTATHVVVACRLDGELAPVLVPLDEAGVVRHPPLATYGMRASGTAVVDLDVIVHPDSVLAHGPRAAMAMNLALQLERLTVSAGVIRKARQLTGFTVAFARGRQYGDRRLFDRSETRLRLAEVHAQVLAAESLLSTVVIAGAANRNITYELAALKLQSSRCAQAALDVCMQVLGGRGYLADYPVEQAARDVRLARIGGGPDEVMGEVIASGLDRSDPAMEAAVAAAEAATWPHTDPRRET